VRYYSLLRTIREYFCCGPSIRFRVMACSYAASRSHSLDTPQSVGLVWMSDQTDAETSDNAQHSQGKNIHAPGGIRAHIPRKANGRRPTP